MVLAARVLFQINIIDPQNTLSGISYPFVAELKRFRFWIDCSSIEVAQILNEIAFTFLAFKKREKIVKYATCDY